MKKTNYQLGTFSYLDRKKMGNSSVLLNSGMKDGRKDEKIRAFVTLEVRTRQGS